MSSAAAFVRHHKQHVDRAISQAYIHLARDSRARDTFSRLLECARERSAALLAAPAVDGHHAGVAALFHLSRYDRAHVRPISSWAGCQGSWRCCVDSLAQHLVARYRVPRFLSAAWYAVDEARSDDKRGWFVAHGAGVRVRSLNLPLRMTRKMEHIFLASSDHLAIERAMRRAELMGLGAPDVLTDAVLATRLATDLTNADHWRTVWLFLIAHWQEIGIDRIGPIVDFIEAQPDFSMKGRTPASVLRLMEQWHRGLGLVTGGLSWERSRIEAMRHSMPAQDPQDPPVLWEFVELTDSAQLKAEGTALRHCVARYASYCHGGTSRIWSLRSRRGSRVRSIITIEVNPRTNAIVQARGFRNRLPSARAMDLVRTWAARERLRLAI